ncbi:MAG TPA: hypothetical protein VJU59_27255 [Paraburkholderia sp.]|uniref:hypothetical protein n=1 Tax=Paraburkholderia sp. TaxID=1926495 RepID=UPI002B4909C7|nr:hypothetical protein [Paraburkholderia sp.]HKR43338.1 hypothetical protein [Paraburkholderia sp.]
MAIGFSLLLGAHLIPAIAQGAKRSVRLVACILWLASMASTGYTHGTFFLSAQQHAGDVRAGQVAVPGVAVEKSSTSNAIAALLRQQAKLQGAVNQSTLIKCGDDCRPLLVRRLTLRSQLDSIQGQLDEARRIERNEDLEVAERTRALARQEALRGDPVSTNVSIWLGVPTGRIDLALAIFFGWLLESIACFSWYVTLSRPKVEQVMAKTSGATTGAEATPTCRAFAYSVKQQAANDSDVRANSTKATDPELRAESASMTELIEAGHERTEADEETLLREALAAGAATNSIADIVRVLGCSESRALALRRVIATTSPRLLMVCGA